MFSALALWGKEGDIVRERKYKLSNVSDLVKIKPKHTNRKISSYHGELNRLNICNLC